MQLTVKKAGQLKTKPDDSKLGFGSIFTDHMFNMDYNPKDGWHHPRIEPYASMDMDPATMVLHYGQGVFEGLKAFRTDSGDIQLFRPGDNFKRLNNSARLLCIPEIDEAFALVAADPHLARQRAAGRPGAEGLARRLPVAVGLALEVSDDDILGGEGADRRRQNRDGAQASGPWKPHSNVSPVAGRSCRGITLAAPADRVQSGAVRPGPRTGASCLAGEAGRAMISVWPVHLCPLRRRRIPWPSRRSPSTSKPTNCWPPRSGTASRSARSSSDACGRPAQPGRY